MPAFLGLEQAGRSELDIETRKQQGYGHQGTVSREQVLGWNPHLIVGRKHGHKTAATSSCCFCWHLVHLETCTGP